MLRALHIIICHQEDLLDTRSQKSFEPERSSTMDSSRSSVARHTCLCPSHNHGSVSSSNTDLSKALDIGYLTWRHDKFSVLQTLSSTIPLCTSLPKNPWNYGESRLRMQLLLWTSRPWIHEQMTHRYLVWPSQYYGWSTSCGTRM